MPFKLSKDELAQRDLLIDKLNAASSALTDAINAYNEGIALLKEPAERALEAYNEAAVAAREFAADIASQAEQDMSEKSEKWLESDRGQAAEAFKQEWESAELDDIELEFPEELSFDDPDYAATLDGIPTEMEV